jgi:hypothetical protein
VDVEIPCVLDELRQRTPPVHKPGHVLETDVARLQFIMIERAETASSNLLMTFESETHFLNAVAFGARAELGFGACRAAAEQDAVRWVQRHALMLMSHITGVCSLAMESSTSSDGNG